MTPAARIAAAALVLDRIIAGAAAEQALTGWARASRFAGSGDRAAVRDLVYGALRRKRSLGALSGAGDAATGRQLMIGQILSDGGDPDAIFDGAGHSPAPLSAAEREALAQASGTSTEAVALDCPDWLWPRLSASLGKDLEPVLERQRHRASVFVRVNAARATRAEAVAALAEEGVIAEPFGAEGHALRVTDRAEKVNRTRAYETGMVEVQDAGSQAICDLVPLSKGDSVLDLCAGGGGKTLALAALAPGARFTAHDAFPRRMADIPARAARAGVKVTLAETRSLRDRGPFDLVVADVPCSGSGTWARDPDAKWRLTPERLEELGEIQAEILGDAARLAGQRGRIAYMTCSLLSEENEKRVAAFIAANPRWSLTDEKRISPLGGTDGFYFALLTQG